MYISFLCIANSFKEVKFSTRCWFLTLFCHHVALIPAFTKHTRRYRTVRDLQKLVSASIRKKGLPGFGSLCFGSINYQGFNK